MTILSILTIGLTFIQFGILFYLFFAVIKITKLLEQQQVENNSILVSLKKLIDMKNGE